VAKALRNQVRDLREAIKRLTCGYEDEAALDAAIEEELSKMTPEEAEKAIAEFLAEIRT
jgi:hypothetical protein